jgi:hypothetical protein
VAQNTFLIFIFWRKLHTRLNVSIGGANYNKIGAKYLSPGVQGVQINKYDRKFRAVL